MTFVLRIGRQNTQNMQIEYREQEGSVGTILQSKMTYQGKSEAKEE